MLLSEFIKGLTDIKDKHGDHKLEQIAVGSEDNYEENLCFQCPIGKEWIALIDWEDAY